MINKAYISSHIIASKSDHFYILYYKRCKLIFFPFDRIVYFLKSLLLRLEDEIMINQKVACQYIDFNFHLIEVKVLKYVTLTLIFKF